MPFMSNVGTPQGDSLSPVLFTIYLENALREIRTTLPEPNSSYGREIPIGDAVFIIFDKFSSTGGGLDSSVGSGLNPWPRGPGFEPQPSTVLAPTGWISGPHICKQINSGPAESLFVSLPCPRLPHHPLTLCGPRPLPEAAYSTGLSVTTSIFATQGLTTHPWGLDLVQSCTEPIETKQFGWENIRSDFKEDLKKNLLPGKKL
ncbi:hypothetical protein ElyMa_006669300 [Elysia marginata]|uniref:Reverse transcriptase domain-containing protein n=1 Tax=Elysia marginata TaxID=1093978 RepID=A0AAV4IL94_9GAST|nr:hypothetical protein ElyMa_006669300 [Elysia marginata]